MMGAAAIVGAAETLEEKTGAGRDLNMEYHRNLGLHVCIFTHELTWAIRSTWLSVWYNILWHGITQHGTA